MRSMVGEVVGRVDIYTDITQARRLYTQLLNSEKLRAIGEALGTTEETVKNSLFRATQKLRTQLEGLR